MTTRFPAWIVCAMVAAGQASAVTPLFSRGYAVLPAPQQVELEPLDIAFGNGWSLSPGSGVSASDPAVEVLRTDLKERFGIVLVESSPRQIRLTIKPDSVHIGAALDRNKAELSRQAYRIDISPTRIDLSANAPAGLFYAAVTLVQLVQPHGYEFELPAGHITDWPDLELRQIYWDDAHHLDRLPVLKAALRQAALFKINGFALKLEGHFQFTSAPAVVEPYALSPAELQELTDYGLRYHVQLIPYLDGPAHIAFILKHPEYAKFRQFPTSNYELCATNPGAVDLLLGMFHDLMEANKGVNYVYVSTDEAYYIGLADSPQCREKSAGTPSELLASFVTRVASDLKARGRTTVFWGEYPLKPSDIPTLPPDVISGETNAPEFDAAFTKRGIRQMIYTSSQGEEDLFPEYFALPASQHFHAGQSPAAPRVDENLRAVASNPVRRQGLVMGTINAGWADRGLHTETFWLGYATSAAAGWSPGMADSSEAREAFYQQFYGSERIRMDRVYQLMSLQAQVWTDSWDTAPSAARKPIWGNSSQIFDPPRAAKDQTLPVPILGSEEDARRAEYAAQAMPANDELLGLLHENLRRVHLNRYNLEVFVSIAEIYRHNLKLILDLNQISQEARSAGTEKDASKAVSKLDHALDSMQSIRDDRNRVLQNATAVWQKSWWPRAASANGRTFLHELDDVKDHLPDRTIGMEYLVYRELQLPLNSWANQIEATRNALASQHGVPVTNRGFDWNFGIDRQ